MMIYSLDVVHPQVFMVGPHCGYVEVVGILKIQVRGH
jgi:hypothetical protein